MLTIAPEPDIRFPPRFSSYVNEQRIEDADLARRVVERDERALEQIYRQHGGSVGAVARKVVRDDNRADDIIQDVFVSFWDSPQNFDPSKGSLRTYLVTIAHRRAVDVVRSEVARTAREEKSPPPEPVIDLEDEIWQRSQSEIVRHAVAALRDDERKAISLAYFGGLSYVDVAQRLGQPEGTVKSRIRSGMKKLSTELGEALS